MTIMKASYTGSGIHIQNFIFTQHLAQELLLLLTYRLLIILKTNTVMKLATQNQLLNCTPNCVKGSSQTLSYAPGVTKKFNHGAIR